jgi:hypothetical protein
MTESHLVVRILLLRVGAVIPSSRFATLGRGCGVCSTVQHTAWVSRAGCWLKRCSAICHLVVVVVCIVCCYENCLLGIYTNGLANCMA